MNIFFFSFSFEFARVSRRARTSKVLRVEVFLSRGWRRYSRTAVKSFSFLYYYDCWVEPVSRVEPVLKHFAGFLG